MAYWPFFEPLIGPIAFLYHFVNGRSLIGHLLDIAFHAVEELVYIFAYLKIRLAFAPEIYQGNCPCSWVCSFLLPIAARLHDMLIIAALILM